MTTETDAAPLLRLENVSKNFGPVQALTGVNLELRPGQVTALVGDNGAGKSVHDQAHRRHPRARTGRRSSGRAARCTSARPRDAAALGIETVYQDLALCDNLDIVQNMFLGRERLSHGIRWTRRRWRRRRPRRWRSLAVTTVRSIRQPVASLSGGQRQSVAIAKAVLWNSKLVIMDEPTAALGVAQTAMVLELVRRLADRGLAVMLVSHNMNDVFEVADRIAVLYLGQLVALRPAAEMDRADRRRPHDDRASRRGWRRQPEPRRNRLSDDRRRTTPARQDVEVDRGRGPAAREPRCRPSSPPTRSASTCAHRWPGSRPARAACCRSSRPAR